MKNLILSIFVLAISLSVSAQKNNQLPVDHSLPIQSTSTSVKDYKVKKAQTAYDIALNCSFMHMQSTGLESEFLILPVLTIDKKPISGKELKSIKVEDIQEYQFNSGIETQALYGTRGQYGHLVIKLRKDK